MLTSLTYEWADVLPRVRVPVDVEVAVKSSGATVAPEGGFSGPVDVHPVVVFTVLAVVGVETVGETSIGFNKLKLTDFGGRVRAKRRVENAALTCSTYVGSSLHIRKHKTARSYICLAQMSNVSTMVTDTFLKRKVTRIIRLIGDMLTLIGSHSNQSNIL